MVDVATIAARISVKGASKATSDLKGVAGAINKVGKNSKTTSADVKSLSKQLSNAGDNARKAGQSMAILGGAIIGVAAISLKSFGDFEQTMARVGAVSETLGTETFKDLENAARDAGRATVFTANESAEALAFMAQAGIGARDAIAALPQVLELAAAGQLEIAASADLVTNVMAGFGLEVAELARANDVLVTGFTKANTDLTQLGQAFKFAGPVAKAAGLSFEETTAALSLMGNAGIQATMAGTALRGSITRLLNPTREAQKALDAMGVTALDSEGNLLPLLNILRQFEDGGLSAADAMTIFGQRAGPGMLALISQGSDALEELTSQMENAGGVAGRIADAQLDTFIGSLKLMTSALTDLAISIGKNLVPMLRTLGDHIIPIVKTIGEWAEKHPKLTTAIILSGVAVGALGVAIVGIGLVLPGIIAGFGLLAVAVNAAFAGIPLIIAGIVLLATAIATNFFGIRDVIVNVGKFIFKIFDSWVGWLIPGGPIFKALIGFVRLIRDNWDTIKKVFTTSINFIIDKLNFLIDVFNAIWTRLGGQAIPTINKIGGRIQALTDGYFDLATAAGKAADAVQDVGAGGGAGRGGAGGGVSAPSTGTLIPDVGIAGGRAPGIVQGSVFGQLQPQALANRIENVIDQVTRNAAGQVAFVFEDLIEDTALLIDNTKALNAVILLESNFRRGQGKVFAALFEDTAILIDNTAELAARELEAAQAANALTIAQNAVTRSLRGQISARELAATLPTPFGLDPTGGQGRRHASLQELEAGGGHVLTQAEIAAIAAAGETNRQITRGRSNVFISERDSTIVVEVNGEEIATAAGEGSTTGSG